MSEWEDITIAQHNKQRSKSPKVADAELSYQVFVLSDLPPPRWVEICNAIMVAEPGRLGRMGEVHNRELVVWGGPKIFDEWDAKHLKKLVAYTNEKYRETLQPIDLSGFEVFS